MDGCSFYRVEVKVPERLAEKEQVIELIVASKKSGVNDPAFNLFGDPDKLQLAAGSELNEAIDSVVLDRLIEFLCHGIIRHSRGKMSQKLQSQLAEEVAGSYGSQLREVTTDNAVQCMSIDNLRDEDVIRVEACARVSEREYWVNEQIWELTHQEDEREDDDQALLSQFRKRFSSVVQPAVFWLIQGRVTANRMVESLRLALGSVRQVVERHPRLTVGVMAGMTFSGGALILWPRRSEWSSGQDAMIPTIDTLVCKRGLGMGLGDPADFWPSFDCFLEEHPCICGPKLQDCTPTDVICNSTTGLLSMTWGIAPELGDSPDWARWLKCRSDEAGFEIKGKVSIQNTNPGPIGTDGYRIALTAKNHKNEVFRHNVLCCTTGCGQ
ncbi:hypothetical protein GNI_058430 [Gregarina niphandrodes]|uniref:Uncharacterized protein n=1 Tax=Gregarina niphandrodes TaxID=110365 RepID=A0A023B8K8_GRENI|nr:hypothetical protein GNI_058430 [Gregarina niphandrodes]EZG69372.1 hypothetical protein GNI_058430 [Gregarina niphandrodes]|eukprot:XP_011134442.1 hypothetical protein GNI_058430 [Gregarina niphandrodes]